VPYIHLLSAVESVAKERRFQAYVCCVSFSVSTR
jgi:hypothetical protein